MSLYWKAAICWLGLAGLFLMSDSRPDAWCAVICLLAAAVTLLPELIA